MNVERLSRARSLCALKEFLPTGPEPAAPEPAPAEIVVSVGTAASSRLEPTEHLLGRGAAVRTADIRTQVSDIVQRWLFDQGIEVRAGQPLFEINPAPFRADADSATAAHQRAEAVLERAEVREARLQPLVEADAISQQVYDDAVSQRDQPAADVATARATLARRRVDLKLPEVGTPIAEGQVASAKSDLEARTRAQARDVLQLLIGTDSPAGLPPLPLDQQPVVTRLPAGLPSDLLIHRPDIEQAERNLVAANAYIGAARAAFFPRISMTTSVGYASSTTGDLFKSGSRVWAFSPQITIPIFNAGRPRSELRLAEVRTSTAVVEYERAIQTAFREVSDGLAGSATYGNQLEAQSRVVDSAKRRTALSTLRYRAGIEGRVELLESQRQLYAARQELLDFRRSQFSNAVALYRALGGGLLEQTYEP